MLREREPMLRVTILSAVPFIHFFSQADKSSTMWPYHTPTHTAVWRRSGSAVLLHILKVEMGNTVWCNAKKYEQEKKNKMLTRCHTRIMWESASATLVSFLALTWRYQSGSRVRVAMETVNNPAAYTCALSSERAPVKVFIFVFVSLLYMSDGR